MPTLARREWVHAGAGNDGADVLAVQPTHIGRRAAPVPRRIVDPAGLFFDGSFDCEIEMRTTADYGLKGNRRTRRRP